MNLSNNNCGFTGELFFKEIIGQFSRLRMEGIEETTSKTRDEQAESHVNQESSLLKAVLKGLLVLINLDFELE